MFGKATVIDDIIEYNDIYLYRLMILAIIELNISSVFILLIASNK